MWLVALLIPTSTQGFGNYDLKERDDNDQFHRGSERWHGLPKVTQLNTRGLGFQPRMAQLRPLQIPWLPEATASGPARSPDKQVHLEFCRYQQVWREVPSRKPAEPEPWFLQREEARWAGDEKRCVLKGVPPEAHTDGAAVTLPPQRLEATKNAHPGPSRKGGCVKGARQPFLLPPSNIIC